MNILLATDGSEYAREATAQCGELAAALTDVTIKIMTVSDYVVDFDSGAFLSEEDFIARLEQTIHKKATEILRETEQIIRFENEDIRIEKQMHIGSAKRLIIEEAEKWPADLIVVGSHGYGFWARALLGSISDYVVHHAPCSVLVVRR